MTRACYEPITETIRADLAPETGPAEVHAGHEGHLVRLRLTRAEAVRLRDQLTQALHSADVAEERGLGSHRPVLGPVGRGSPR